MVRRCCVENCNSTDLSILSHRFPKPQAIAMQWRDALNITSISLEDLQKGSFVVCTKHFKGKDYRNEVSNCLNTTAIPNRDDNSSNNERIMTTKGKEKSKQLTQLRCHKVTPSASPEKISFLINEKITESPPKNYKNYAKKIRLDIRNIKILPPKDVILKTEETDFIENDTAAVQPIEDIQHKSQSTMTDTNETNNQEVQVNLEVPSTLDKDDKMIKLLYPNFAGLTKMELVKLLVERDLKISSLQEKEKQLEDILTKMI